MVARRHKARSIAARPWEGKRWLVLAPHADDETLGVGALIAQTAAAGFFAGLVYLTDGSGSHPCQDGQSGRLVSTRKREATHALARLTGRRGPAPFFLGWHDANPLMAGEAAFDKSCRKLAALCLRLRVHVLATTAATEPHCDHVAAATLADAVQSLSRGRIKIAEYMVWGAPPPVQSHHTLISARILPGTRRKALAAHRSQLTPAFGAGFRLPKEKQVMAAQDLLYVRKR